MATVVRTQSTLINLTPDLNEFNFGVAQLINNTRTTRTQTKIGVIPNPLFELKLEEWRNRDLQREREIEIMKQKVDRLPCFDFEKAAIKRWIDKDKGYFKLETYVKYVQRIDRFEKELRDIWETNVMDPNPKGDPSVFWTKKDGNKPLFTERVKGDRIYKKIHSCNHYTEPQKIHDRNYAISDIRNQYDDTNREFRFIKFVTGGSYENKGAWVYKNDEAEQNFLKEVEEKGIVVKKLERKQLDTTTKKVFELGYIKDLEQDNTYSLKDLNRFKKVEEVAEAEAAEAAEEEVLD